ncbi:MAG: homoserine kinase [Sporichthyaceae bacterium]
MTVRVRVPATSANLGPGFDSFGLGLGLYDDVVVERAAALSVEIDGHGADTLARDESHLLIRSMRAAAERLGEDLGGVRVHCTNRIPHGRGLGSSSAAIVAGVLAGRALVADGEKRMDDAAVLDLVCALEGHPDNVAAALFGGFTLAWTGVDGPRVLRLEPSEALRPVLFVPDGELLTEKARGLLPATVPHADAAANSARAALLVEAITRRPDLLLVATEDRLHQAYRRPAMPDSVDLVDALRAAGLPATVSGAGPTVLALAAPDTEAAAAAVAGPGWDVRPLAIDRTGATVQHCA